MPRKEEPVHTSVLMAQQLMTRLGDFTAVAEDEDLFGNIKALADTFVSVGERRFLFRVLVVLAFATITVSLALAQVT